MNDQEIFTPEERDENTKRKRDLIELVDSGEAILFVGAGSSVRMGYPDWFSLLQKLEDLASKCGDFKPNIGKCKNSDLLEYLEYAESIKSYISEKTDGIDRYYNLLYDLFKPKNPSYTEFHRLLVELPFRGILTTNYDPVLTEALSKKERDAEEKVKEISLIDTNPLIIGRDPPRLIHEFLLAKNNDLQIPQRIAHLHGVYRNPESIILGRNDYQGAYGLKVLKETSELKDNQKISKLEPPDKNQVLIDSKWTLRRKLLWAVLATRRVVFIGFSLNDPYFNKMLETVSKDLWGWNKSIHFAIMGISSENFHDSKSKAERLKEYYGIDTVFYEVYDNSHQGLDRIVYEIAKECGVEIPSTIMAQYQSEDPDSSEEEKPTPVGGESRSTLDWLEQANENMEKGISDDEN